MKARNIFTSVHVAFILITALAVCFLLYHLLTRFPYCLNLGSSSPGILSNETKRILNHFDGHSIHAIAFYSDDHPDRTKLEDLLRAYASVKSDFSYRFCDPDKFPSEAKKYSIDNYGILVIEAMGKEARLETVSEQMLTDALAGILFGAHRTIYFVTGHNEPNVEERGENGYLSLSLRLKGKGHDLRQIDLTKESIPKDAALTVLSGPHADLSAEELGKLETYLNSGGRLFAGVDPVKPSEGKGLQSFLTQHGVRFGDDVVVDMMSKEFGADYLIPMVSKFGDHESVHGAKYSVFFPVARSVRRAENPDKELQVSEIAFTAIRSWAETDLSALEESKVDYDEGFDYAGPIPLAAVSEDKRLGWKIAAVGDSDFLNNAHLQIAGNKLFVMSLLGWLLDEKPLVRIVKSETPANRFVLDAGKETILFISCVAAAPILFLVLGFGVWQRRRRLN